jgi:hypothetical protein
MNDKAAVKQAAEQCEQELADMGVVLVDAGMVDVGALSGLFCEALQMSRARIEAMVGDPATLKATLIADIQKKLALRKKNRNHMLYPADMALMVALMPYFLTTEEIFTQYFTMKADWPAGWQYYLELVQAREFDGNLKAA